MAWIFPIKIFGYFAAPDKYIHSMPFGTKNNNAGVNKNITPPDLSQYPPGLLTSPDSLNPDQNSKTVPADSPDTSAKNSSLFRVIFIFASIFIFTLGFIFYKFKKYKNVI